MKKVYKIPINNTKKWWQFWKKDEKSIAEIIEEYRKDIIIDDMVKSKNGDYWFPEK